MKITSLLLLVAIAATAAAQPFASFTNGTDWVRFAPASNVKANTVFTQHASAFGLRSNDAMQVVKTTTDALGHTHYRYQQHYQNIPVEGAIYVVHEKHGRAATSNGKIVRNIALSTTPQLDAAMAIDVALQHFGDVPYLWNDTYMEAQIKRIKNDDNATFYPSPELVIASEHYSKNGQDYRLAWKMDIFTKGEHARQLVYVDAQTGAILYTLDQCHSTAATGTAETRYSGTQTFQTDFDTITNLYRLRDYTRGGGVETFDLNQSDSISDAVDFLDLDNYWNVANAQNDNAAYDAHWGSQVAYDYYLNEHGRNSYDDNGSTIISYIHKGINWFNARWTGQWMEYGDGTNNPLTSIDVVGHELTHGVTGNSAGLIYQNESGALNESFSDIFGTAIEFYGQGNGNWLVGTQNFTLRDMSDPNSFGDPDTYFGAHWWTSVGDNGGVHTNSGVQNHWFYLLTVGGNDTNDLGDVFNVTGLGMDKAAAIAYRNLSVYLTPSSNYFDARQGAIQSAEDLYGSCSFEVLQTIHAWYAVGVGADTVTQDVELLEVLAPVSTCSLGTEQLTFQFKYHRSGCGDVLNVGDTIPIGYRINGGAAVLDTIFLANTLNGGDSLIHTFSTTEDFSTPGSYQIDFWTSYENDDFRTNDTIFGYEVTKTLELNSNEVITFEDQNNVTDSFFVITNTDSRAVISPLAANTGSRGFLITGQEATLSIDFPQTEADNFILNPQYGASLCFCVDATGWSNARLSFDLKQTHSLFYEQFLGLELPNFVSSLRVMVDGVQMGNQFHPITNNADPYLTHYMNLDAWAGSQFELCFEGKHFMRREEDPIFGSPGDNSYLDNIFVLNDPLLGVEEYQQVGMQLYPNPNRGEFTIEYAATEGSAVTLTVTDMLGKTVLQEQLQLPVGVHQRTYALEGAKGVYLVQLQTDRNVVVERMVVE